MLNFLNRLLGGGKPVSERRQLAPPGQQPQLGASLVKDRVVMKVTVPMSEDFWNWLVLSGWREVRMARNRRRYVHAPERFFTRLARADLRERERLCRSLLHAAERHDAGKQ